MKERNYLPNWMLGTSVAIAALALIASLMGLFASYVYSLETENWRLQAQGQDIGNIAGAVVLVISAVLAKKGSFKAYLVWLGTLFYFLYAYIIYAVAVHFNNLFLVYVAALGLTLYTVIFALRRGVTDMRVSGGKKQAGYTLSALGVLFGLMWLGEIIPASISGVVPQSLKEAGLWVNPIHVIDLSTVLPGFILAGYLTLKSKKDGLFFAAPWLVFSVLMGSSIVAAMMLMVSRGFSSAVPPMVMVSVIVLASLFAGVRYLRKIEA